MSRKSNSLLTPAGAYIRMSSRQQDKSPAEQRAEITKLAAREGCRVVEWFTDGAITGDSTADDRPGLAALLAAAKAHRFTMVLAWHTNRISREDPMDAIVFYNQLRKAGVDLHTCCEGAIALEDFAKQLLLFVNQKASNDFLSELSAKSLRGKIANAKLGGWNGGSAPYGMARGEFDPSGQLIRRLAHGDRANKGNHLRLVPSEDRQKLEAVQYAFTRFDTAHISKKHLARRTANDGLSPAKLESLVNKPRSTTPYESRLRRRQPMGGVGLGNLFRGQRGERHFMRQGQGKRQATQEARRGRDFHSRRQ